MEQKAFPILENSLGHPNKLMSDDWKVIVRFLPPNCTWLIQPRDQNIIQTIKLCCCEKLLFHTVAKKSSVIITLQKSELEKWCIHLSGSVAVTMPKSYPEDLE
jgi:hypothetical protein